MREPRVPRLLAAAVDDDGLPERHAWLARLPPLITELAASWDLERCRPGHTLGADRAEPEQDAVVAALLRRLWAAPVPADASFRPLQLMCDAWAAGNVLAAEREPWLVIDPKPFAGDPAYDAVQHMLNCDQRLATDPVGLARRMAGALDLDPERVARWLFARCAQEALGDVSMRAPARMLASVLS